MPSEAISSGHGLQGLANFGLTMRCLQTRQVTTGNPFFGGVHVLKAALSGGGGSRTFTQAGKAPLESDGVEEMAFMPIFLVPMCLHKPSKIPCESLCSLHIFGTVLKNRPRILSSVQRKNVLFQSANVSLFSYRMIVSWTKYAALGRVPDQQAALGMHFPLDTL